jgi:two-component system LytT family response regulator
MSRMSAIVVDDEPLARARLVRLLAHDVDILAECGDGRSAIAAVKRQKPDLLFLDVQMPELDGFGVLAALPQDDLPSVVFVTAFDRYAVRAFDAHAVDYLLKPFDAARLERAVARARARDAARLRALVAATPMRLPVSDGEKTLFVPVDDIDYLEAEGNYVAIHACGRSYLVRDTLSSMEARLDPARFVRIHRSRVVAVDRVRSVEALFHGEYRLTLDGGVQLTSSRRCRDALRTALNMKNR